jgi:hypothetical protein
MTEPCFVRSTEPKGRRRQFCGRCLTMRRTKSSGIGSPMFSKSRSGRARLLDGHRPTAKSGSLQAQCSRELGQPGSLVTLPPGVPGGRDLARESRPGSPDERLADSDKAGVGGRTSRRRALKPPTITEPTSDLTVFVRAGARGACGPDPRGARPDSRGSQNVQLRDSVGRRSVGRVGGVA